MRRSQTCRNAAFMRQRPQKENCCSECAGNYEDICYAIILYYIRCYRYFYNNRNYRNNAWPPRLNCPGSRQQTAQNLFRPYPATAFRYTFKYSVAVCSQEKLAAIALRRKCASDSGSWNSTKALRMALASARAEYSPNLIPLAFSALSLASITVSSRPPVMRTIGMVP